jgi:hypothetical protein
MPLIIIRLLVVAAAALIFFDSYKKRKNYFQSLVWTIAAILLPHFAIPFYIIIYVLLKPKLAKSPSIGSGTLCPKCGHINVKTAQQCEKCNNHLAI